MKKRIGCIAAAMLLVFALVGCGNNAAKEPVSTDGSTSMSKVIGALSETFEADTGITVTYNATGSGSGIQAVEEGRCDIGLSSRSLKDEEKAKGLQETVLAYDGIAMIVNPANPVQELDLETIARSIPERSPTGRTWAAMTLRSCSSAARPVVVPGMALNPSAAPRISASIARS